jgi:hypothetical protein
LSFVRHRLVGDSTHILLGAYRPATNCHVRQIVNAVEIDRVHLVGFASNLSKVSSVEIVTLTVPVVE